MLCHILVNGKDVKHFKNQQVLEFPEICPIVSHQLIFIFDKPGNGEEIPRDQKGQSLNEGYTTIVPSNHELLSLTAPGKTVFAFSFSNLKDIPALIVVQ